jgi:hypothetical protein
MATIVTLAGSIKCKNGGTATLTSAAKLTVGGRAAVLFSGVSSFKPVGCTFPTPSGTKPCTTFSASSGQALKLTAGSQAVLLSTASITTDNADVPVAVKAGHSKVTAS